MALCRRHGPAAAPCPRRLLRPRPSRPVAVSALKGQTQQVPSPVAKLCGPRIGRIAWRLTGHVPVDSPQLRAAQLSIRHWDFRVWSTCSGQSARRAPGVCPFFAAIGPYQSLLTGKARHSSGIKVSRRHSAWCLMFGQTGVSLCLWCNPLPFPPTRDITKMGRGAVTTPNRQPEVIVDRLSPQMTQDFF